MFDNPQSGMITVHSDALTLKLYCTRSGRKDDNRNELFSTPFRYVKAGYFGSNDPKCGKTPGKASLAMLDSALETVPGRCEENNGGTAVVVQDTGGDAAFEMTLDVYDCTRKRSKGINTKGRKDIARRQ